MQLNGTKILGIMALLLGFIAIFAGDPYGSKTTEVNKKDLLVSLETNSDKVSVTQLADWIIQAKSDFRLIDVRSPKKFSEYFIPTAENIQISTITESDLRRNENIIIYAENDFEAASAYFLLKADNYKGVKILDGGLTKWKESILFPSPKLNPTKEEEAAFAKLIEVSKFFGGTPQVKSSSQKEIKMPALKTPIQTNLKRSNKRVKREGC